jgi:hypothetical protein
LKREEFMSTAAKSFYLLVLSFVPALGIHASELRGVVVDSEGSPIPRARILVHWDSSGSTVGLKANVGIKSDLVVESKANGEFGAELPPGFYDVFVSASAFSPECRKIRIKSGEVLPYNAKLKADPIITKELGDTFPH